MSVVELFPKVEYEEQLITIRAIAQVPKGMKLDVMESCFVTAATLAQELAQMGCKEIISDIEVTQAVVAANDIG